MDILRIFLGRPGRLSGMDRLGVCLGEWVYTSLDHVHGAATTSVLSSPSPKLKATCDPYAVVALPADTKSTGCYVQVMARSDITAEKLFDLRVSLVPENIRAVPQRQRRMISVRLCAVSSRWRRIACRRTSERFIITLNTPIRDEVRKVTPQ
jgi:hypothetical protein